MIVAVLVVDRGRVIFTRRGHIHTAPFFLPHRIDPDSQEFSIYPYLLESLYLIVVVLQWNTGRMVLMRVIVVGRLQLRDVSSQDSLVSSWRSG